MSHREARRLAENIMKNRLGRDLSSDDYDRLADALLRLRAAARELRRTDDVATRARERDTMQQALADIQTLSGLQASDLGAAVDGEPDAR